VSSIVIEIVNVMASRVYRIFTCSESLKCAQARGRKKLFRINSLQDLWCEIRVQLIFECLYVSFAEYRLFYRAQNYLESTRYKIYDAKLVCSSFLNVYTSLLQNIVSFIGLKFLRVNSLQDLWCEISVQPIPDLWCEITVQLIFECL